MSHRLKAVLSATVVFTMLSVSLLSAGEKEESIAVAMAEYLISARSVIAQNQKLINDEKKGDKGFTADVYEKQLRTEFMMRTSIDINQVANDDFGKAITDIHQAAKQVVNEAQGQINAQGKGFKGFNPAAFGARLGAALQKRSSIAIKQTSQHFRATYNQPDEFETSVLNKFATGSKDQNHTEETTMQGKKVLRHMVPLYIAKSCLGCHGDPAGSLDISGHKREGYKEGDLRGAISVVVPVK